MHRLKNKCSKSGSNVNSLSNFSTRVVYYPSTATDDAKIFNPFVFAKQCRSILVSRLKNAKSMNFFNEFLLKC